MTNITLYYPTDTIPVSVTGKSCSLNCRHCGGFYLRSMKCPDNLDVVEESPSSSPDHPSGFLISGGCNEAGAVPLWNYASQLKKLRDSGFKLNIHTGLIPLDKIPQIAPLAHVVSFDFITHNETIREVYGSKIESGSEERWITGDDYVETYRELRKNAVVVPHITIGLLGGEIMGEYEALERLREIGAENIVFLVFMPTKGTFYESHSPPPISEVEKLVSFARQLFPSANMGLGCMHPRGNYKFELEKLMYSYRFNSFVNPSGRFRRFLQEIQLKEKEIEILTKKECCAFC